MFYGAASVLNKAFFLLTLPLLARHFGVEAYGTIDFLNVLIIFLTTVVVLGQDSAVARQFWDDRSGNARRQMISQSLALQLALSLAASGLLLGAVGTLPIFESPDGEHRLALMLVVLHLPFMVLMVFAQGLLKWTFARREFAIITIGHTALHAIVLIAAVLLLDVGLAGVFTISLASRVVFAIVGLTYCRRWLIWPTNTDALRALLALGIPFAIIGAVGTMVPVLERAVVGAQIGPGELGKYAVGASVALIVSLPIQAFQMGWGPFALAIHLEAGAAKTYNQVLKGFAVIIGLAVVALSTAAPVIVRVLAGENFVGGAVVVAPLALALAIQGVSWITEVGIVLSKRTYLQLYAYAIFLLVASLAMLLLGSALGLIGVAIGIMVGHLAKAVAASLLAQRAYPMPWAYGRTALVMLVSGVLAFGAAAATALWGPPAGAVAGAAASVALLSVGWYWLFEPTERKRVAELVRRRHTSSAAPLG